MSKSKYELNMTEGSIFKGIIRFAVPLMLSSMMQLFFNAADLIVAGRWSGSVALASVGATSSLVLLIINLFIGMSVGTTVVVSRSYGAGDNQGMERAVHTSMMFSIIVGLSACGIGQIFCKQLLVITGTPAGDVLKGATLYMRIIFVGTPATVIYNYGAAVLRSVGDTKRPLYILTISGVVNFVLNLIFVICFNMGVAGVAAATVISKYLSVVLVLAILMGENRNCRLEISKLKIHKDELLSILKIGVPAGLHNTFTSLANTVIQSAVNSFGAAAIAGNAAAMNVENFAFMVKNAFRQATVTAVSQNYGAKDEKRMIKSVKVAMLCMVVGCFAVGGVMALFSKQLLGIYITDSAEAIKFGVTRMFITSLPYFISGIMEILSGYLRGIGYSTLTTVNSFVGLFVFRVVYTLLIFPIFGTFESLYICTPITWGLVSVLDVCSILVVNKKAMAKMRQA